MRKKWLIITALLGAMVLVAAACGGEEEGPPTNGTPTDGVDTSACEQDPFGCVEYAAGEPIKFGTLLAISGDVAFLGTDSQHGVELGADFLDGTFDGTPGQILGHDIEFIHDDDGCSAEGGQAGATRLVADQSIVAVFGTSCSSSALGVADKIFSDRGVLLISPSNTNPNLTAEGTHQPYYARTAHNDLIQGAIVANFIFDELGVTSAATINDESPYADALAAVFRANFEAKGGTITAVEAINSADTEFGALLTSVAESGADAVYFPDFNPACSLITRQALDVPALQTAVLIGSDGCLESAYLETVGTDVPADARIYSSGPYVSSDFYVNQLLPAYREVFGSAPTALFHAHSFDAFTVVANAIEQVGIQLDDGTLLIPRTAFKDAVLATSGHEGVSGAITCNELGDCASGRSIGIFQYPDWPVEGGNPDAQPVFQQELTLDDVIKP